MATDLNFFCGFIIAAGTYYLLCWAFPIPATSEVWNEVGDEITEVTLAYHDSSLDEETGSGFGTGNDSFKGGVYAETEAEAGVHSRKGIQDF